MKTTTLVVSFLGAYAVLYVSVGGVVFLITRGVAAVGLVFLRLTPRLA